MANHDFEALSTGFMPPAHPLEVRNRSRPVPEDRGNNQGSMGISGSNNGGIVLDMYPDIYYLYYLWIQNCSI